MRAPRSIPSMWKLLCLALAAGSPNAHAIQPDSLKIGPCEWCGFDSIFAQSTEISTSLTPGGWQIVNCSGFALARAVGFGTYLETVIPVGNPSVEHCDYMTEFKLSDRGFFASDGESSSSLGSVSGSVSQEIDPGMGNVAATAGVTATPTSTHHEWTYAGYSINVVKYYDGPIPDGKGSVPFCGPVGDLVAAEHMTGFTSCGRSYVLERISNDPAYHTVNLDIVHTMNATEYETDCKPKTPCVDTGAGIPTDLIIFFHEDFRWICAPQLRGCDPEDNVLSCIQGVLAVASNGTVTRLGAAADQSLTFSQTATLVSLSGSVQSEIEIPNVDDLSVESTMVTDAFTFHDGNIDRSYTTGTPKDERVPTLNWGDRIAFVKCYGSNIGNAAYSPRADFDLDGDVDEDDREAALDVFAEHCLTFDYDGDGFITGADFDDYSTDYLNGLPQTDTDCDGFVTGNDYDVFVYGFEAGC